MRDICAKFGIPNSSQSPDIRENSNGSISDFLISRQSCINENCCNFRASNNTDMKLVPETNLTRKTLQCQKHGNDVMPTNCDVFVFFPVYGQIAGTWKPDSGRMIYKFYIFINNILLSYKT